MPKRTLHWPRRTLVVPSVAPDPELAMVTELPLVPVPFMLRLPPLLLLHSACVMVKTPCGELPPSLRRESAAAVPPMASRPIRPRKMVLLNKLNAKRVSPLTAGRQVMISPKNVAASAARSVRCARHAIWFLIVLPVLRRLTACRLFANLTGW